MQGFRFGKPAPAETITQRLAQPSAPLQAAAG
jgi:hypothetical protein